MSPASTLPTGFTLRQATTSDLPEIFRVCMIAVAGDPLYRHAVGSETLDASVDWCVTYLAPRWAMPDIKTWAVVEESTGKIVAWGAMQFPWKDQPLNAEDKAIATSHEMPPLLPGMHPDGMAEFFASLSCTASPEYDYDPEKDYHRKGSMVHPDFQKRGFGTLLAKHCNAIADGTGGRTWAPARPTSKKMFEDVGYKVLGSYDSHLERWGLDLAWTKTYVLMRDPQPSS